MGSHSQTIWYAERAAGIVSYFLLTLLVVLGLTLSNRVRTKRWPMFAIEDVHRFVGIVAAVFIALHISLIAVDPFLPFSLTQIFVPFTAGYRPLATGLGTVELELLVAVAVANAVRRRIPYRLWRATHYLGFVVWSAATVHGLVAGSDRRDAWLLGLYVLAVAAIFAGIVFRTAASRPRLRHGLGIGLAGAAIVVGVLALLPASRAPSGSAAAPKEIPASYEGTLVGQVDQQVSDDASLVSIDGRATGTTGAAVRIDLLGNSFGVERTALQIRFDGGATCVGTVSQLGSQGFAGACNSTNGQSRSVRASWTVNADSVRGSLTVT
jgi:methionine sulfoxide reductase heme-binding subunit